ncbi:alpha-E domain-containing protein [uncultured Phascolarctobacterium sp.]|uniref:alpha-E domain-containing protein n=1 Tax=uncultured Phascolarctobacterium sp. TaxID=512296 RepID=UPI0025CF303C|nr:alpha-E domain-containing protein [uncultured Phascolarctobacterium sp.]
MGIISLEKSNHLYWLGRYSERAFTTIRTFMDAYDTMLDNDAEAYKQICAKLSIPDVYGCKESFIINYLFDETDPNSVYSNLSRACDNASVMRDVISSTALGYVQLALDVMEDAKRETFCLLHLQEVLDDLYAFWGCIDDYVESSECRNIMKCGRYIERLDLYIRLDYDTNALSLAYTRMLYRLERSRCDYDKQNLAMVSSAFDAGGNLRQILPQLNNIFRE